MKTKTMFWYLGMLLLSFAGVYFSHTQSVSEMVGGIIYGVELLIVSFALFFMLLAKQSRPYWMNMVLDNEEKEINKAKKEIPAVVACECCVAGGFFLAGSLVLPVLVIANTAITLFMYSFVMRKS